MIMSGMATAAWSIGLNVTFYDNIIFNNGWDAPDRGHGHGFYTQNDTTTKEFSNNVVFNNMGNGIQVYGKGSYLSDFIINNNTSFNNGIYRSVSGQELNSQILIGGEVPARGIVLGNNYAYCEHAQKEWYLLLESDICHQMKILFVMEILVREAIRHFGLENGKILNLQIILVLVILRS